MVYQKKAGGEKMKSKSYQASFVDFIKKLELDEINLLIYIAKLASFHNTRFIKVSYIDVSYHLHIKGKGSDYVKRNISKLPGMFFEKEGQFFPFFERVYVRNNHFEFTLTHKFEEESDFRVFIQVMASLIPTVLYNINKHHAVYLYLKLKEELNQRGMIFDFSLFMSTEQLKSVFGLEEYDYVGTEGFNRSKFEKIFLVSSVEQINRLDKSISLEWKKVKENRYVTGYLFECTTLKK